jgi:hypothetical protein
MQLVWDQIGERSYEYGVDHGVLYLHDGTVAVWNGITEVEESSSIELKEYHLDGVKYLSTLVPGDFEGKLKAITYPDEFDSLIGQVQVSPGLTYYDQPPKSFNLSYRTKIGNDLDEDYGYTLHILYNVVANPENITRSSVKDSTEPADFSWSLTGVPPRDGFHGARPTVHVSIDSNETPPDILAIIENTLYGNSLSDASLPSLSELAEYFGYLGALIIVDHGDGSWSAIDESDNYIEMLDSTTFEIEDADTTTIDADTYTISSTNVG